MPSLKETLAQKVSDFECISLKLIDDIDSETDVEDEQVSDFKDKHMERPKSGDLTKKTKDNE